MKFTFKTLHKTNSDRLGFYKLTQDWEFYSERLNQSVVVPAGFEYDEDSVPRLPLIYLLAKNRSGSIAPCAHDYLYLSKICSRKEADLVYLDAMKATKVGFWQYPHYLGVRLGGWVGWRK